MSPRVYSAYSGDILDYIAVFNRKKVSLPFLIPLHAAFFFPSFFPFLPKSGPEFYIYIVRSKSGS